MTEPAAKDNARLAERLLSIGQVLRDGGNGHANGRVVATGLSDGVVNAIAAGLVPFMKNLVAEARAPLEARNAVCEQRLAELEARLLTLEQQPSMKYCGTFDPQRTYFVGDFVT